MNKIAQIEKYLAAARARDEPAMRSLFSDELVYRVHGRSRLAGETHGRDAALRYFAEVMALSQGTYGITGIDDFLESAERVVLIAREHIEIAGRSLDWRRVVVFRFSDSAVVEIDLFDDRQAELDELIGT